MNQVLGASAIVHETKHKHIPLLPDGSCPLCRSEMTYRPITVQEADAARHLYAKLFERGATPTVEEYNRNSPMGLKIDLPFVLDFAGVIRKAPLFFWRQDLWKAAQTGYEVFLNTKPRLESLLVPPVQLHLLDRDWFLIGETCEALCIPEDINVLVCMLIVNCNQVESEFFGLSNFPKNSALVCLILLPRSSPRDWLDTTANWFARLRMGLIKDGELITQKDHAAVISWLEFMKQPLIAVEQHRPPRAERRRMERDHRKEPDLRVIALRRVQHAKTESGEAVNWNCQWCVSGHWRQQWYASEGVHRPRYIHSYIKGPEDKPLKQPVHSIYEVRR